jgi:signal transduction histidine kinase/CheY-like chemotaxis protein
LASLWKPYVLSVVVTVVGVALTRMTWPVFASAPFAPVFAGVAIATHWGNGRAGLLAVVLGAVGLSLAFLPGGGVPFKPITIAVYALVGLIGTLLIDGRNRATAALKASEAELRSTLETVRASEEAVRRAHKMEAVGQLAAGVAHNFNNLLQVTMGYTDILLDDEDPLVRSAAAEIRHTTERGAALTRQLLAFGRKHVPRAERLDPGTAIAALRDMVARLIREDIELTMDLEPGFAVVIDPSDFEQVILNLLINARDALPGGGRIHVVLDAETVRARTGADHQPVTPGRYVRLRVRDNGVGMSADVQEHLFEPFFTTKEVGAGTGLGLAFVQGVARQAGGFVSAESEPARGTTISVYLPAREALVAPPRPGAAVNAVPGHPAERETILLVEDEEAVRRMTAQLLARAGYTVLAAAGPSEALTIFDEHESEIGLLLTDIVMPDMHGPALADRLTARRRDLPVLFVSGYSEAMPRANARGGHAAFLPKPFTAATLLAAVRTAMSPDVKRATPS